MEINKKSFYLKAIENKWDSDAICAPVITIEKLLIKDFPNAEKDISHALNLLKDKGIKLVSCRLPSNSLRESMLLESCGFKFIEVVLHPYLQLTKDQIFPSIEDIKVVDASKNDVEEIAEIASKSFSHERFHVDYRIQKELGNNRYKNWVLSSIDSQSQKLIKFTHNNNLLGFFIIEQNIPANKVYWHLTAIVPSMHGKGFGRRCWEAMLIRHQIDGLKEVSTTISSNNIKVLNLYSKLNFRFLPSEMTFHLCN